MPFNLHAPRPATIAGAIAAPAPRISADAMRALGEALASAAFKRHPDLARECPSDFRSGVVSDSRTTDINLHSSKAFARDVADLTPRLRYTLCLLHSAYADAAFPVAGIDNGQLAIYVNSGFLRITGGHNVTRTRDGATVLRDAPGNPVVATLDPRALALTF